MENAMKKSNKNLIGLEIPGLVRVCLNEALQSGSSLAQCKSTLEVVPSYLLYALCIDPVFYLFNEKNIFLLINNFFKKDMLEKLGCESATQLLLLPLKTIQAAACDLVLENKHLKNDLLENIAFSAINKDCSLSILPKTNEFLQNCYPVFEFTNSTEVIKEHIASTEKFCLEDLKQVAIGDKIKLCDNFQTAVYCTYCDPDESSKLLFKLFFPNESATDKNVKKFFPYQYKQIRRINITNLSREEIDFKMNNNHLGERIIETSACESVNAIRIPFFEVIGACFSKPLFYPVGNETPAIRDDSDECKKSIGALTKNEKEIFCEKPSFFFQNKKSNNYFNHSLQAAELACNNYFSEEDELQKTLDLIKSSNTANNITNDSIEEISPHNISDNQVSLLVSDKLSSLSQLGSIKLINTGTSSENSAIEYSKITAITGAGLFGIIGVGYWLFKRFRNNNLLNNEARNDNYVSESSEPLQRVSYSKI